MEPCTAGDIDWKPVPRRDPRHQPARVAAIAFSLILHLAGLLWLSYRAIEPMPRTVRPFAANESPLLLYLLDSERSLAPGPADELARAKTSVPGALKPQSQSGADLLPQPLPAEEPPPAETARVSADRLFASLPAAAKAATANDAGSRPVAGARLPGGDEAKLTLPLRWRQQLTPERVLLAIGGFLNTGSAPAAVHWGGIEDRSDPLVRWTEDRMRDAVDPRCNDPERPRIDERCLSRGR